MAKHKSASTRLEVIRRACDQRFYIVEVGTGSGRAFQPVSEGYSSRHTAQVALFAMTLARNLRTLTGAARSRALSALDEAQRTAVLALLNAGLEPKEGRYDDLFSRRRTAVAL